MYLTAGVVDLPASRSPFVRSGDGGGLSRAVTIGRGLQAMEEPSPSRVAAEAPDLLSSFPAQLQDEILRRLDLRDAVRTSALSRAWRRRWQSIAELALSFPDGTPPCVVDRVLLYTGPRVSRFAFRGEYTAASHVDHWLIALSRSSVESISIQFQPNWDNELVEGIILHSSMFSCARLVSLDLKWCDIPLLPVGFSGLPVLEELSLSYVKFRDHGESQLQAIIRGSPLLRVLSLEDVDNFVDCVIETPNLHSLTIFSTNDEVYCRLGELPCLQEAEIHVCQYSWPNRCLGFLAGTVHVRELTFYSPPHEFMIDTFPFTFYNLKSLHLRTHFNAMTPVLLMFYLLRSSPNLEELKIEAYGPQMVADWEFLNAQWTDGMCANLQIVQITGARLVPIALMKLILSKASHLHTLSVDDYPRYDPLTEILTCRRASAQAQVLFKV